MYLGPAKTYYDSQQRVWSGRRAKDLYGPEVTLGEAVHFILSRLDPNKVVQVTDPSGEELTAAQLLRSSKVLACQLQEQLALAPGDVIGIAASNTTYLSCLMLAAFFCGTPTHAIYNELDKESVKVLFEVTRPKVIFCDVQNCDVLARAAQELNLVRDIFLLNGEKDGFRNVKELLVDNGKEIDLISLPCSAMTGDDTAAIACSSGSTGSPKGVLCSHRALLHGSAIFDLRSDSVLFAFSTLYWVSGLLTLIQALLNGSKRVITDRPFSPEYFQQLVAKHRITHTIVAPYQMAQLLQVATPSTAQRLASIRCILCGGSRVPQAVSEGINKILGDVPRPGLTVAYGMTEISGVLSQNDGGPGARRDGSTGKLMANMMVKIVDKDCRLMAVGGEGVVHIRTPYQWAGYYRNPEATREAYVDGWLASGDIGYFDAEGFLHIVGRDSDIFKSNNMQISPGLIEEVVLGLRGVSEACVFGVPDSVAGHLTACAVVRAPGETDGRSLTAEQIENWVERHMAAVYHLKRGVFFVEALPKTGSGKILRTKVPKMIKERERVLMRKF